MLENPKLLYQFIYSRRVTIHTCNICHGPTTFWSHESLIELTKRKLAKESVENKDNTEGSTLKFEEERIKQKTEYREFEE